MYGLDDCSLYNGEIYEWYHDHLNRSQLAAHLIRMGEEDPARQVYTRP